MLLNRISLIGKCKKGDNKNSSATNAAKLVKCATLKQTSALVKSSALDAKVAECVKEAQKALRTKGSYVMNNGKPLSIDGVFGPVMYFEVCKFQKNMKLQVTGIIDNATKAKL